MPLSFIENADISIQQIERSARKAAGRVLPVSQVLRSVVRIRIDVQFARYRGSNFRVYTKGGYGRKIGV